MRYLLIVILILASMMGYSQTEPSGFPTQFNTGWQQWGFQQSTKGTIIAKRDTLGWLPRYTGTTVVRPQDRDIYYYDSTILAWKKLWNSKDTLASFTIALNDSSDFVATTKWVKQQAFGSDVEAITADNGLTKTGGNIQLEGTLIKNTTINTTASYFINITGANVGQSLKGTNTSTGAGVMGQSTSGSGVYGLSTSLNGVLGVSASGTGLVGESTSGEALNAYILPSSTNNLVSVVRLQRFTQGTASNGIGGSFDFYVQSSAGSAQRSNRIGSSWTNATTGSRTSILEFFGVNSTVEARKAALTGAGQWVWDGYPALTAQIDTATYKPVAIDGSGNVVRMAGWAGSGGGGGGTLNNVGGGYRWAATPSGDVKTFYTDITGTIDSTSNANGLTFKTDTTIIATHSYVNNNASVITSQEGILYSKSSWTSTSDFVIRGATASVAGTSIQLSGGVNTFSQSIDLDTTMRERWVMHIEQRVGAISSTSDGLGIGIRSVNPNYTPGIAGILITNNTGNAGKLLLLDITAGGTVIASSSASVSFSAGDTVVFELERDLFTFTLRGFNRTTGSATVSITYEYVVTPSPPSVLPNTGTFSVFSVGGTQLMTNLSVVSKETKHAPLMCIGDSKTVGYYSSNIGRYSSLASYYFGPTITHAGSADRLNELLETTDEVLSIRPINATISIGSNDIAYGATVAQVFANYKQYVSILQNGGINVFHLLPFYQPTIVAELDSLADSIRITYPAANIIDCRTPIRECPSCYLSGDNVHLNSAGDSLVARTMINSGLLRNYYKSPLIADMPTLDVVLFNGNTSAREAKTGHLYINTTAAYDVESFTLNGSGFMQKDQNSNTFWVIKNATNGANASTSTTLYNNVNDYLQEAIYSSSTSPVGDIAAGSSYTLASSAAGHSIALPNGPLKFLTTAFLVEKARMNQGGEFLIGSSTDQGAYTLQNTGGLYQNGSFNLQPLTAPPGTYNILVHGLTDSVVYQVPVSVLGGGITTLNTLTAATQTFATGTSGTDFNISSSTSTHTFNIPSASTANRGLVTTTSQTLGGQKTFNDGIVATSGANSRITINGNVSVSGGPSTYGDGLAIDFFTHTNTGAAGTISAAQNFNFIASPTLTSSNAISYTDDVSTIRFAGAPIASGSTTISHPWNIFASDVSHFAGLGMALNEQSGDVTLASASGVNVYTGAGGNTWTLPALATHPGKFIFIKNAGGGNLTVQRAGSDNIYDTSSVTSITIAAGVARVFMAGSSFWYVQ